MHHTHALVPVLTFALGLLSACDKAEDGSQADAKASGKTADGDKEQKNKGKTKGDKDKAGTGDGPAKEDVAGKVVPGGPVDYLSILQQDEAAVYEHLGEPKEKGSPRKTCARFVPERVRFGCEVRSDYWEGPADTESLVVEFENGKASAVSLVGLIGEGEFTPVKALSFVGLDLPGDPREQSPQDGVVLWDYFNPEANLKFQDREHRVLVSVVENDWTKSKVEVRLNDALNEDERELVRD